MMLQHLCCLQHRCLLPCWVVAGVLSLPGRVPGLLVSALPEQKPLCLFQEAQHVTC